MNRLLLISAGILGFLGVALGAFGAHVVGSYLSESMLETYKTGILYHLIHVPVLLVIAVSNNNFKNAGFFIITGIILFSFSLYAYSITGMKFLAMITPVGGISFLIAWLIIIFKAMKYKSLL